jgi:hypothetical protein
MYPVSYSVLNLKGFPPRIILPVRKLKECLKLWTGQEYAKVSVVFYNQSFFTYQHFRRTILLHYKNVV